jgi:hypothetical protein
LLDAVIETVREAQVASAEGSARLGNHAHRLIIRLSSRQVRL